MRISVMKQYEFYLDMLGCAIQNIENLNNGKNISIEVFKEYLQMDLDRLKHYYEELKKDLTNSCLFIAK